MSEENEVQQSDNEEITNEDSETIRSNGEVVFDALTTINGPATVKNVVDFVAACHDLKKSKIREPVKDILTAGYNLGFLSKKGAKYMIETKDLVRHGSRGRATKPSLDAAKPLRDRSRSQR